MFTASCISCQLLRFVIASYCNRVVTCISSLQFNNIICNQTRLVASIWLIYILVSHCRELVSTRDDIRPYSRSVLGHDLCCTTRICPHSIYTPLMGMKECVDCWDPCYFTRISCLRWQNSDWAANPLESSDSIKGYLGRSKCVMGQLPSFCLEDNGIRVIKYLICCQVAIPFVWLEDKTKFKWVGIDWLLIWMESWQPSVEYLPQMSRAYLELP